MFTPTAFGRRLESLLPPDEAIDWQRSGHAGGSRTTKVATFAIPRRGLACVGMERSVKDHHEAAANVYAQAIAVGYYCRPGTSFSLEEAMQVAAAMHM